MQTGIVVSNHDPLFRGRCKIRVDGKHTEKMNGKYVIFDDDLPWASPAQSSMGNSGSFSLPNIGDKVYVEMKDTYTIFYYGSVGISEENNKLLYDNAEECDGIKILLSASIEDSYVKVYYIPNKGFTIDCDGNTINMPSRGNMVIKNKKGVGIEMNSLTNDITIHTDANINLDANRVNLSEGATERVILESKLLEKFNNHTHFAPGGSTNPPTQKLTLDDFSDKVRIL